MSTEKKPCQRDLKLFGVFSIDFEQAYGFLVSNKYRLIQLGKGNSRTE